MDAIDIGVPVGLAGRARAPPGGVLQLLPNVNADMESVLSGCLLFRLTVASLHF
jgi:hypothetical protein